MQYCPDRFRARLQWSGAAAAGRHRSNELEHHMFSVVRYAQIGGNTAGPTAVARSAFTFGEGTLVTCWHCVKQPVGPDEFYGIAVRRGGIESPYEFCSIDNLERDHTTVLTSLWVTLIGCLVVA